MKSKLFELLNRKIKQIYTPLAMYLPAVQTNLKLKR